MRGRVVGGGGGESLVNTKGIHNNIITAIIIKCDLN